MVDDVEIIRLEFRPARITTLFVGGLRRSTAISSIAEILP